tara:strand:+ start:59 stop:469 length:411 start_codon:yes stop_codon:yes gene_type:complete
MPTQTRGLINIMNFDELNDNNFLMYAMKLYDNPQCVGMEEFKDDLNRVKYVKRLLKKYFNSGVLRERLILNHIIILANVFGIEGAVRMLFYRVEKELHPLLKTFLVFLEYLPEKQKGSEYDLIPLDPTVISTLRKI